MGLFRFPLSGRALLAGAVLSALVAAYSAFAGLKVGGVYWPIATTSLVSMVFLLFLGRTNRNEINIMQTAGSSGGLLAAGIIFTVPAAFMLGLSVSYLEILIISLVGGLLGISFSYPLRKQLIERENLPCADGAAAAALIEAGDEGGEKARTLMYAFGLGAVFSIARDSLKAIPSFINLDTLKIEAGRVFSLGSAVSLIPVAGGFLIGPRFATAWFLGAIFTFFITMPFALSYGLFTEKAAVLSEVSRPLGIGIVLGSAIAYFLVKALPSLGKLVSDWRRAQAGRLMGIALIVCAGSLALITNMDLPLAAISVIGAFAVAYIAARSTGEMNVDPMEIFAMLVMLAAKLLLGFGAMPLIVIAAVVTIAAGMAGDMMQDLKTGYILKTRLEHQIVAQIVGMLSASIVIGAILFSLNSAYGIGSAELPAPQALAVKEIASAPGLSEMLMAGMLIGIAMTLLLSFKKPEFGIAAVAFGIGMYVPMELSLPLMAGGIIRHYAERARAVENGRLIAAGTIAGEGLVGTVLALSAFAGALAG